STAAIEAAEPTCGPPIAALRRVVECQLDLGPIVLYVYNEPTITADPALMAHLDTGDEAIVEVLARVSTQRPTAPPRWARRVFWALLQAEYKAPKQAAPPRVQIADAIMPTLPEGTINAAQPYPAPRFAAVHRSTNVTPRECRRDPAPPPPPCL